MRELAALFDDIEREGVPERLLALAIELQARLAERRPMESRASGDRAGPAR